VAPLDDGKDVKETVAPPAHSPWSYDISSPGWLADMAGTLGIGNVHSHVYTPMDFTIRHVDMMGALALQVRYEDRWGLYGDVSYVKVSQAIFPNSLVSKADTHTDQWMADLELNYRLLEGPKGYLDVRAGVRYQEFYNAIIINANNKAIDQASQQFVDEAAAKVADKLSALKPRLAPVLADLIRQRLVNRISGLQVNRPSVPIAPLAGGVDDALTNAIQAKVGPQLAALQAQEQAQLSATTAALKAAAQSKIDALKQRIASDIASTVKKQLNTSASLNNRWLDPYVGIACRYDLDKVFYLTGKTDIGGFGIGSEITWQAYIGLGCQLTHSIYAEAGYRYLYTDYTRTSFLYDITQSGAQITMGLRF
jgi:opacity protein-like surface antigen